MSTEAMNGSNATNATNATTKGSGVMKNAVACIISNSGTINVVINGKPYSVAPDHSNYRSIIDALNDGDSERIVNLVDIPKSVDNYTEGSVKIVNGQVVFQETVLHNSIANRILGLMGENMPSRFMVKFLENLMQNPSFRAVNELYDFLEYAKIPITDDGCFLAYKRVRNDYMDIHSGTIRNMIGDKPFMLRNMVDEDKGRTCSAGLHFCSLAYISQFGSNNSMQDRVMIVKINPADVVAIPADYKNTKGRCCKYEVVAEYEGEGGNWKKDLFTQSVYNSTDGSPYNPNNDDDYDDDDDGYDDDYETDDDYDNDDGYDGYDGYDDGHDDDDCLAGDGNAVKNEKENEYGVKPSGQKFYNVRDVHGHFVKKGA